MDRGYLTLAQAGEYCGWRSPRWARRHLLPNVPYVGLPGSGAALFKQEEIDTWLAQFRREPVNVDAVIATILTPVAARRGR